MTLTVFCNDFCCFLICQIFNSLLSLEMKLYSHSFVFFINHTKSMTSITIHVTIREGNTPVTHRNSHLVNRFRKRRPKIPVVAGTSHICLWIAFDGMIKIKDFKRISQEEYWKVVAHQIPVSFMSRLLFLKIVFHVEDNLHILRKIVWYDSLYDEVISVAHPVEHIE